MCAEPNGLERSAAASALRAICLAAGLGQAQAGTPIDPPRCPAVAALEQIDYSSTESIQRSVNRVARKVGVPLIAYALGRPAELERQLRHGASPNQCVLGASVLMLSVASRNTAQASRLLAAGAHPDVPADADGGTALHMALLLGDVELARLLLQHGADASVRTDGGTSTLHQLAAAPAGPGRLALADELIRRGASVNAAVRSGSTVLMVAVAAGDAALVELLIKAGADPTVRNARGATAADLARKKSRTDLLALLGPEPAAGPASQPNP